MSYKMDTVAIRKKAGLNQTEFWGKVGVTQSGGSRYESGINEISTQTAVLLELVYGRAATDDTRKLVEKTLAKVSN